MVDMPGSGRTSLAERLVDESPDALIALSLDGRIRSWNRGAAAMFGYTAAERRRLHWSAAIVVSKHTGESRTLVEALGQLLPVQPAAPEGTYGD
jgi:PAS domain S-box-containing protein